MNLCTKQTIISLLKKHQATPLRQLGQNFLIDKKVLGKIIDASHLKKTDIVLEIGPGIGTLTKGLAKKAKEIIAVEKDRKMAEILKETLKDFKNIKIIQGDILKISNFKPQISNFKLVSNLPYSITSPVIRMFLEAKNKPSQMILLVQKEVAQRLCASPPKMNLLAVATQFYGQPKIIDYVSKNSFWPRPKVDSAILRIREIKSPKEAVSELALTKRQNELCRYCRYRKNRTPGVTSGFFKIVRAGFSSKRKQLINSLSRGLKIKRERIQKYLLEAGIKSTRRAETLTLKEWITLYRVISQNMA